ncbi:MAG: tetratricopeptide repeat protein [Planctomycetota bacterium]
MQSLVILLIVATFVESGEAQTSKTAQRRNTRRTTTQQSNRQAAAVSQDLLKIYESTKKAATEERVSAIIAACKRIYLSKSRSQTDRDYARSLLGWGLNRRGELRNDRAAKYVAQGGEAKAEQLDRLAAEDFRQAIEYDSKNWRTHHNYAISLAMNGEYQSAIDELSVAIDLQPEYANSHFNRGELYFELGDYESAVGNYTQAIELNDKDPQFFNSRGHSRFMLEEYDEALNDYVKATELAGNDSIFHTDLADAYQFLGQWEAAAEGYQQAVASNSKNSRAYQNAAWLMATCPEKSVRNASLALAAAKKAIELSDRNARTLDTLAAALAASGKQLEAAKIQSQAVDMSMDDDEKEELTDRLRLYQRGSIYRQPQPAKTIAKRDIDQYRVAGDESEINR